MTTFVLVHGAWHGGWCWNKVTPLLRKTGAEVFVPTLSGLGEKAHLSQRMDPRDIDLDLHVQDVAQLLEYEGLERVVLVGHAYAGMVITGVAEACPERLAHLVYVNGVVPSNGESMADQLVPVRGAEFAAWVRGHIDRGEGFLASPASPEELGRRWGIDDPADRDWMFARVTPQPAAAMAAPVRVGRPEAAAIPRSFVCGAEAGFQSVADRVGEAGWGVYHVDSGHDTMVSHPRELAEILLGIASAF
jgi:pimeloyl-ACP methyl ester carboxylesterase